VSALKKNESAPTLVLILFLALTAVPSLAANDTVTMAFTIDPSQSVTFTLYDLVYEEAFKRLGIEFRYTVVPPARVSAMADMGTVDGEPLRNRNYNQTHTNLVLVDESIFTMQIQAFATNPSIHIESWESFRDSDYRVAFYRSAVLVEQKLSEILPPENVSASNEHVFAFRQLLAGRIDVYVDSSAALIPLMHSPEFKGTGIRAEGILMEVPMYTFMHKSHAALATDLASVLKQMKEEGLLEKYRRQAREKFSADSASRNIF